MLSMAGAENFCAIRSYLSTAKKQGIGILDALTQAATGTAWIQLRHSNGKDNYPGNLAIPMAALRLAVERGLESVTVEDITAEAGVSLRTFGNYFSSKYEAICAIGTDRARRIGATLLARPAGEPLWDAIAGAMLAHYESAPQAPDGEWMARPSLRRKADQSSRPADKPLDHPSRMSRPALTVKTRRNCHV